MIRKQKSQAIHREEIRPKPRVGKAVGRHARLQRFIYWSIIVGGIILLTILLLFLAVNIWPALGANGADLLRSVIGDRAVAGLEMIFNQLQDNLLHWGFQLGLVTPATGWNTASAPFASLTPTIPLFESATASGITDTPAFSLSTPTPLASATPRPEYTPTQSVWQPIDISPLGTAKGEGIWLPYIENVHGDTVAYRTFLQPDPSRPYTLVAIVAIDLSQTRLHFVLGTIEPAAPNSPPRSGEIPKTDKVANVLLAAFNGGFKARHGQFGAMADGTLILPPRDGLGTLVIYKNGEVRLGEWGQDVTITPDVISFRQNGPLVIQNGEINPRIYNNSPQDWGYTVNDVSPTVRSGVGLSADNRTLYYFCGPSLSMEMLAKSMQAAGAMNAIQLDINNYWVLFVKIQPSGSKLIPEALLPRLMVARIDRYLWDSSRDYFYITSNTK